MAHKHMEKCKYFIESILFQLFLFIIKTLPFSWGCKIGQCLGELAYYLLPARRRLTLKNIQAAKAHGYLKSISDERGLARDAWRHLGLNASEFLYYHLHDYAKLQKTITLHGQEHLDQVLAKKKGVILVAAHFGNWELLGSRLALAGYKINAIVKIQSNKKVDNFIATCRQKAGIICQSKKGFLRPVLRALDRNEMVSFLIDQSTRHNGHSLNFFGRTAFFPKGAAEFALRTDTPVLFTYIVRERPDRHHAYISEEIILPKTGDAEQDVQQATELFAGLIQQVIEAHPEQWLWTHRLWR